jgi:hypothetical protein
MIDLEFLKRLVEAATPGPWSYRQTSMHGQTLLIRGNDSTASTQLPTGDVELILALRNSVPDIIAQGEQLAAAQARVAELAAALEIVKKWWLLRPAIIGDAFYAQRVKEENELRDKALLAMKDTRAALAEHDAELTARVRADGLSEAVGVLEEALSNLRQIVGFQDGAGWTAAISVLANYAFEKQLAAKEGACISFAAALMAQSVAFGQSNPKAVCPNAQLWNPEKHRWETQVPPCLEPYQVEEACARAAKLKMLIGSDADWAKQDGWNPVREWDRNWEKARYKEAVEACNTPHPAPASPVTPKPKPKPKPLVAQSQMVQCPNGAWVTAENAKFCDALSGTPGKDGGLQPATAYYLCGDGFWHLSDKPCPTPPQSNVPMTAYPEQMPKEYCGYNLPCPPAWATQPDLDALRKEVADLRKRIEKLEMDAMIQKQAPPQPVTKPCCLCPDLNVGGKDGR